MSSVKVFYGSKSGAIVSVPGFKSSVLDGKIFYCFASAVEVKLLLHLAFKKSLKATEYSSVGRVFCLILSLFMSLRPLLNEVFGGYIYDLYVKGK